MKYGLLVRRKRMWLCDDIQSIAARLLLPRLDILIPRDSGVDCKFEEDTKILINDHLEPDSINIFLRERRILPLFISYSLFGSSGELGEHLLATEVIAYYKLHEPIGCRDLESARILSDHGVRAYFSGCLVLTLNRRSSLKTEEIGLVDVPREVAALAPPKMSHHIIDIGHTTAGGERFQFAYSVLDVCARAKLVITSRFHCALACLAFGTPVFFITNNFSDMRYGGMGNINYISMDLLLRSEVGIPWSSTPFSRPEFGQLREIQLEKCLEFLGPSGALQVGGADLS